MTEITEKLKTADELGEDSDKNRKDEDDGDEISEELAWAAFEHLIEMIGQR
jgi:hypothetical protein